MASNSTWFACEHVWLRNWQQRFQVTDPASRKNIGIVICTGDKTDSLCSGSRFAKIQPENNNIVASPYNHFIRSRDERPRYYY
jgi:hypothetical protein